MSVATRNTEMVIYFCKSGTFFRKVLCEAALLLTTAKAGYYKRKNYDGFWSVNVDMIPSGEKQRILRATFERTRNTAFT